jgi:PadR family transcriptional regulator, regulatory protein AphA
MKMTISPEPALLGFLRDRPIHGYELYKRVEDELGPVWHLGLSQMYAILNDYAERGWIRTRVQAQGLRPSKKVLELTAAGRKAFEAWMILPARGMRELRVDFFARLYFARLSGRVVMGHLIDQQIAESRQELDWLEKEAKRPQASDDQFRQAVRQFRIDQLHAALRWLEGQQRIRAPYSARPGNRRARTATGGSRAGGMK